MAILLTPPEIDRRPRRDDGIRESDNGNGRRPPTDKRTGGNGDGDNWSRQPQGSRGPRERLSRARVGMFFVLFVVAMLFIALISADLVTRANGHFDAHNVYVKDWQPTAVPAILWLNTLLLLISTMTAEAARRRMFREHDLMEEWLGIGRPISRRATLWLSVTLALGLAFLAGQYKAWMQLAARHAYLRHNPSSHFFYLLTATHAVHLVFGITALIVALVVLQRSRSLGTRQIFVDSTVWYWHAMSALWMLLFALLEYGQ
jgi:cytochrome c oxidase subunit 3